MDMLHAMSAFAAVVDAGGFAGAARRLGLSPPAVTRAINELEAHLGVRLLTRTTRAVRATEAGARYAEDCRRILQAIDEADESASGAHAAPKGRLSVAAPSLFGARFVAPVVSQYLLRYPEMRVSCWFLDRVVQLLEEGVDAAVRIGDVPDSGHSAVRVGQVRRVVCAAPAYLEQRGTPDAPEELAGHAIVAAGGVAPAAEWRLLAGGSARTMKLEARLHATTHEAALQAALAGVGITRLPWFQVAEAVKAGRLRVLLGSHETAPLPVHVVHREGRHPTQKVRAFVDLAVQALRAEPLLNP
ncbi:MAG: LysR family transcriptional regulator [Burkholderiaceae bacterium]